MGADSSNISDNVLEQNCRLNWPLWTCIFGNVSGMCSTTLWFIVLLPQVWKNFRRKSVKGLSVLWATANFTASLINLFFVFIYVEIPLYVQISSVYCPVLEFALLVQFWIYGRYRKIEKLAYAVVCFLVWGIVIAAELVFEVENVIEYAAITLWCVETFPQILLNMKLQSTGGQATISVAIAMTGKTTDFFANNLLVMPLQYVIMCYFSSSVAYINGFQVAWYYGQDIVDLSDEQPPRKASANPSIQFSSSTFGSSSTTNLTPKNRTINKRTFLVRIFCMVLISCLLIMCVVGFVLNIGSLYGLFAPVSIALILSTAYVYFARFRSSEYTL